MNLERLATAILREVIPLVDLSGLGAKRGDRARKVLEDLKHEYPDLEVEAVLAQLGELEKEKSLREAYEKLSRAVQLLEEGEASLPPAEREKLEAVKAQLVQLGKGVV